MDDLMDDERIEQLARELGDEEVAERLVAARGEVVGRVPDHVTRAHMGAILTEIRRTHESAAAPATTFPPVTSLHEQRRTRVMDAAVLTTRLAAAAIGIAVLTTGGLAAANALPVAAQTAVADLAHRIGLDRIGIEVPSPPAGPPDGVPTGAEDAPRGGVGAPGLDRRDEAPGRAGRDDGPDRSEGPGRSGETPARNGEAPGHRDDSPGTGNGDGGRSSDAPGRGGDAPEGSQRDRASEPAAPAGPPPDAPSQRGGESSEQPPTVDRRPGTSGSTPSDHGSSDADEGTEPGAGPGRSADAPGARPDGDDRGARSEQAPGSPSGEPATSGRTAPGDDQGNGTTGGGPSGGDQGGANG